jgi:hypothetical protein
VVDRTITYTQAVPRSQDFLQTQKDFLLGLGYLSQAVLGQPQQIFSNTVAWVDGLTCNPASPPSMNVTISSGSIYEMEEIDATSYGVLGVDTGTVLKQGLLTSPVTMTCTPPATSGYSQYYLVEAIYNDVDGGPTVLPYYNAANPLIPLGGPGNSGQQQYTVRQGVCVVSLKAGVAAPTGTQAIPPADAGFTPLWSVLVSNGQIQITNANIAIIPNAPFISPKLTQIPPAIQAQVNNFAIDLSTSAAPNAMAITLPSWTNVVSGLTLRIQKSIYKNTATPTLSINGGPPVSIAWADGNALQPGDWPGNAVGQITFTGTSWELYTIAGPSIFARVAPGTSPTVSDASLLHYGVDTGTANAAVCASVSPTIGSSVTVGMTFEVQKTNQQNSGSMTFSATATIGGTVVAPLYWADGNALQVGDWPSSAIALIVFDGTYYRLLSVTNRPIVYPQGAYVHYGVASGTNTLTLTSTPIFSSMSDGLFLEMNPTSANTGPVTLSANGLSPSAIQTVTGNNLSSGQLQVNQPVLLMALGGVWKLLFGGGGAGGLTNMQVLISSGTYYPTAGAQKALVIATGGGGGGGASPNIGGGGGAGATAISVVSLSGITSIPYTIGAGGSYPNIPPQSGITASGGAGGWSQFGSTGSAYCLAPGGSGGSGSAPGNGATSGIQGALQIQGGDAWGGSPTAIGSGNGGCSFWGGGGVGGSIPNYPGRAYGSGGGGEDSWNPIIGFGAGAPGVIVVLEF